MLHRIKKINDMNKDKWIGIGGKFEDKESPEECMIREVFEETGLTVKSYCYRAVITFVSNEFETEYMHLFTVNAFSGTINPSCEEGVLEWIKKDDVSNLPSWEGDKIFLELIAKPSEFFSLKLEYNGSKLIGATLNGNKIK